MVHESVIAVDWGTSNLRAFRLATDGRIVERRTAPLGILKVADGAFEAALFGQIGAWLEEPPPGLVILSGMIGSRQGWVEVPYVACPAGLEDLAAGLVRRELAGGWRAAFVPGVACRPAAATALPPDVMRGEEIQILGALGEAGGTDGGQPDAVFCLPGTHSKWARVEAGRIVGFTTHMTGEVFDVLTHHSILGRLMSAGPTDLAAFDDGLARAEAGGGLLHHLFGVRTRGLFAELAAEQLSSYLSGILIGHEVGAARAELRASEPITVIGADALAELYHRALVRARVEVRRLGEEVGVAALHRLARLIMAEAR